MALLEKAFHHKSHHRFLTGTGSPLTHSMPRRLFDGVDTKLCLAFGVVAGGLAAAIQPEKLQDVVAYVSTAVVVTPVLGKIVETILLSEHAQAFYPVRINPKTYQRELQGHIPYAIDKNPDGVNNLPIPHKDAEILKSNYRLIVKGMLTASAIMAPAMAATIYQYGYWPNFLLVAPMLSGLTLRFMAAAERFDRLKSGQYCLVKLPIRPASGRSPAP